MKGRAGNWNLPALLLFMVQIRRTARTSVEIGRQGDVVCAHKKGSSPESHEMLKDATTGPNREFIGIYLPHIPATSEAVHASDLGPTFGAVSSSKGRRTLQLLVSATQSVAQRVSM